MESFTAKHALFAEIITDFFIFIRSFSIDYLKQTCNLHRLILYHFYKHRTWNYLRHKMLKRFLHPPRH